MPRRFALVRLFLGLSLVVQTLIGPAIPIAAQTIHVTFTPSTVGVGGDVSVTASGYDVGCEAPASVSVVSTTTGAITPIGTTSFDCANGFTRTFKLPTSVGPGTYRVRVVATRSNETYESALILTVAAPTGGTLRGTAACVVPPSSVPTILPFATVTVFSGAAQVATTRAAADGSWTIPGTAPNASYTVRYQAAEGGSAACGASVTTNPRGDGAAAPSVQCPSPDGNNLTWLTPVVVQPTPAGTTITDSICKSGQSRWYQVPIGPGQQVAAEVLNPNFDVTLALFRDIRQAAEEMNAASSAGLTLEDVRRFTASIPRDVAAPDVASPDVASPDVASPDVASPDVASPDVASPDVASPDVASPDVASPDVASPDVASPDVASPDGYSAAQLQSILAFSDKPGPASEFVRRHTWDNTGNFYIRVRGHNDAFDETHPFSLRITVVNRDCDNGEGGQFSLNTTAPSFAGLPSVTPRTLILTNSARFPAGSDTAGLLASLNTFANRREIGGAVVDLAGDTGLAADYTQWDTIPDCVPAANIVANQIHRVLETVRAHNPSNLQYVVLAGGDHVLPFVRLPDQAGLSNEHDFSPAVLDFSASQASLKTGYFLTQDPYGSFSRISLRDHLTPSFDVPVGRLVENVTDIRTMLTAYAANNGVIQPTRALVTGYDFLADSSAVERSELAASGLAVDSLIQPEGDGPLANTAWHADDLRARLLGTDRYGILAINAHFSGNTLLASDMSTRVRSREIAIVNDGRFTNSLIMSMGCHSGYNIVDTDATQGTQPIDWGQAFAQQGATVIGGTGYQYGNTPLIKYSEVLLDSITHQLRLSDDGSATPVTLGRAIVEAKRAYVTGGMNGIDEKTLSELTLYGLPMMSVNLPTGRIARSGPPALIAPTPSTTSTGLAFADLTPGYVLSGHDRVLNVLGGGTTTATYFDATYGSVVGDTTTVPGLPVVPRVVTPLQASNTLARGAVALRGTYTDLSTSLSGANAFRPLVDNAPSESRGVRPVYASSVFAPAQLAFINDLQGQFLVEQPFQFRSNGSSVFGTGRRYDSITSRVYYSNRLDSSALSGPPVIYSTLLRTDPSNPSKLLIDVTVGALRAADVENVFATFTSEPTDGSNSLYGRFDSLPLTAGTTTLKGVGFFRHYTGVLDTTDTGASPDTIRLFIQAVGGNGLVSLSTNNGNLFHLVTETATLGSPKLSTAVALQQGIGVPYDATYRFPLHVSARLTNAVTGSAIGGKPLTFHLGRASARTTTAADGTASADLPVLVIPDSPPPVVGVEFAEDTGFLGSSDRRDVTVHAAPTAFVPSPGSIAYASSANIARLVVQLPAGNRALPEVGVRITLSDGRVLDTLTDGFGQVLFDTLDFEGVQPGAYATQLDYFGSERYRPARLNLTQTVTAGDNHSLALNGTGFAEAPHSADLNLPGNWTIETWFKDEDRKGFDHNLVYLIDKRAGLDNRDDTDDVDDTDALVAAVDDESSDRAEGKVTRGSAYFVAIVDGHITAGFGSPSGNDVVSYDLIKHGVRSSLWHHVAVTFRTSTAPSPEDKWKSPRGTLTMYLDGRQVQQEVVQRAGTGNSSPLEIGRSGRRPRNYFEGKLDDLRIWSIARSASDIQEKFRSELSAPQAGLVANWKFNERIGTFSAFSTVGAHTAVLSTTGARFSDEVHP